MLNTRKYTARQTFHDGYVTLIGLHMLVIDMSHNQVSLTTVQ